MRDAVNVGWHDRRRLAGALIACLLVSVGACDDDASSTTSDGGGQADAAAGGTGGQPAAGDAAAGNRGDAAPGAPFSSGVSPGKTLGQLTPAEVEKVCQASESFVAERFSDTRIAEALCRVTGLFAASLLGANVSPPQAQLACVLAYAQCKNAPPAAMPDAGAVVTPPNMCTTPDPSCTLTVAEYERCLSDAGALADQLFIAVPDCSQAGQAGANPLAALAGFTEPASCTAAEARCPGLDLFGNIALPNTLPGLPGLP